MDKLEFTFDEELFGAFQHGDWRKQDEIETAIKRFLRDIDIEEIRADNGMGYECCANTKVSFDTRSANRDNRSDEFLILKIQDREDTNEIPDAWFFSSEPIYIPIKHGDKLVFEKHGNVARIMWENAELR